MVEWDIFPLFVIGPEAGSYRAKAFLGTGFLIAPQLVVTCWHLVRDAVDRGDRIVIVGRDSSGAYRPVDLENLSQDSSGRDLASARVGADPRQPWTLSRTPLPAGSDVFAFGYPLTQPPTQLRPSFELQNRYLEGYVTRSFNFDDPVFGASPAYELDMRAPAGISGAPLVRLQTREIVGVVFGRQGVETLESFGLRDPDTGKREPDVMQVEYFALAHYTETLLEHRSAATGGRTLRDIVP